jgi:hypothetical protein
LRKFLPRSFPLSLPLSADPQIRALADPNTASDVEKQVVTPNSMPEGISQSPTYQPGTGSAPNASSATLPLPGKPSTKPKTEGHVRTMTMNSADAPEVVPTEPESPPKVRRSQTACQIPAGRSVHHPHHPNFTPGPPPPRAYSQSSRPSSGLQMHPISQNRAHCLPARSTTYHFDPSHAPRPSPNKSQYHHQPHSQSQHFPQSNRWPSQRRFDPSRSMPQSIARRSDVEIIYPSTRRPRSSTLGGASGPLSCILETASNPRASVDEHRPVSTVSAVFPELPSSGSNLIDQSTYRGANRTSLSFYSA